jgi:hypothetical protein
MSATPTAEGQAQNMEVIEYKKIRRIYIHISTPEELDHSPSAQYPATPSQP